MSLVTRKEFRFDYAKDALNYYLNDRINILEQRIKRVEWFHSKRKVPDNDYDNNIREIKSEVAELLKVEEKNNILMRLPLYSVRITGFRFYCSSCYEKAYKQRNRRKL
jgi:hypothetical protein